MFRRYSSACHLYTAEIVAQVWKLLLRYSHLRSQGESHLPEFVTDTLVACLPFVCGFESVQVVKFSEGLPRGGILMGVFILSQTAQDQLVGL